MLRGRRGHARVAVLTVIPEELDAVRSEFGASVEVETEYEGLACWSTSASNSGDFPVVVAQSLDRSNTPALQATQYLIEDWRPEVIVLVGIAGGIVRATDDQHIKGVATGDVVCIEFVHYADYVKREAGLRKLRYLPMQYPDSTLINRYARPVSLEQWHEDLPVARPDHTRASPLIHFGELVALEFLAGDGEAEAQREALSIYDNALAVDMESFGVARAMHTASTEPTYRPVWLGVRGISDRTAADEIASAILGAGNNDQRARWKPYAAASAARFAHRIVLRILRRERGADGDPGAPAWPATTAVAPEQET